jgi:hypothetical protein
MEYQGLNLKGTKVILFNTTSRQPLAHTKPPSHLIRGPIFLGLKRPDGEADDALPSTAEAKKKNA